MRIPRREFLKSTVAVAIGFGLSQAITRWRKPKSLDANAGKAGTPQPLPGAGAESAEVRFLVLGDWGWAGVTQAMAKSINQLEFGQAVAAEELSEVAASQGVDFVVSVGDNFYPNGVTSVDDPRWHQSFEAVYRQPSLQIPWYVALGNHDYRGSAQAQVDYTKRSNRWRMPARYYSFNSAANTGVTVEVFVLDTCPFVPTYRHGAYTDVTAQDARAQLDWLEASLAKSTAVWKLVVGHHPLWTGGIRRDLAEEQLAPLLEPIFRRHGVKAYFCGHEHDAQHLELNGLHCFVHGNGSEARPTGVIPLTHYAESRIGFGYVCAGAESLTVHFLDGLGEVRHTAVVPR